jgi:hypothetical protein
MQQPLLKGMLITAIKGLCRIIKKNADRCDNYTAVTSVSFYFFLFFHSETQILNSKFKN